MEEAVFTKRYKETEFTRKEILRYAGVFGEATRETEALLDSCIEEARGKSDFRVCYCQLPVRFQEIQGRTGIIIGNDIPAIYSNSLEKNLQGCERAVLFGATVGLELDRLISRYGKLSPSRAVMLQAIGAERIEALCELFNKNIVDEKAAEGFCSAPRFSPGYGDLDITLQRDIFRVLDCHRKIGLSLNESMLMSPAKSVTAIIGLRRKI